MNKAALYAAIDLGSNSFHMLVLHEVAGASRTVAKVKRKVRLAAGLQADNSLSLEAMERGWRCLELFAEQLQDVPAEHIRIVGTATLRLASNLPEFLTKAEAILGHPIKVISGEQEAALIYEGVAWTSSGSGRRLVIDIGGASTELVIGEGTSAQLLNSVPMGCVTWLSRYFADNQLNQANFEQAITAAQHVLTPIASHYLKLGWHTCIGASGTVQAIQEIMVGQGEDEHITLAKLLQLQQQAIACGHLDNLNLPGLKTERISVFPSGLAILIALFEMLAIERMTLAGGALREGLMYRLLGKDNAQHDAKARTAASLIARYQLDQEQGERVRHTAQHALNQLNICESYSPNLTILSWAGLLYELGLCIEYKQAPQHAAYIVKHLELPGFTAAQQQLLSALLLNQRDDFELAPLQQQSAIAPQQAILLARLLRLAIILCLRRARGTVPAFTLQAQGDTLILQLPARWEQTHPLRISELQQEAKRQTAMGWPLIIK